VPSEPLTIGSGTRKPAGGSGPTMDHYGAAFGFTVIAITVLPEGPSNK